MTSTREPAHWPMLHPPLPSDDENVLDGATDEGTPNTWPATAGEFAARWNARTPEERERLTQTLTENAVTSAHCLHVHHDLIDQIDESNQALAALRDEHDEALRQLGASRVRHTRQSHELTIDVPSVPYGPQHVATTVADAAYYRSAARSIRHAAARGEAFAGSNVTETVAKLCDEVADKLGEVTA